MEATASGALLRRVPFARRLAAGDGGMLTPTRNRPVMVRVGNKFEDQGHLRYYAAAATPARCGPKREEKRRMKLVKGLERDLSALYSMGFDAAEGQDQGQQISEAAELLLAQLTKLRAETKEMKQRRKQEKAAMKAAKMKDRAAAESPSESSDSEKEMKQRIKQEKEMKQRIKQEKAAMKASKMKDRAAAESSSESSDSECEAVVKMSRSSLRTVSAAVSDPVTAAALQTEDVIEEAKSNLALNLERQCCSSGAEVALMPTEGKIEVCMGGKCKKSGAMELMAEFEKVVGAEGVVVGCKCMGKCRDGPNVRVVNQSAAAEEALMMKIVKGPLCIGVGLEDVGPIVAKFLGEGKGVVGLQPAA